MSEDTSYTPPAANPVAEDSRIAALDVLRGVAVLGILYMNIQAFAMIEDAYSLPILAGGFTGWNYVVWAVGHLLFEYKYITIFSALFGAGVVLMTDRLEATGRPVRRVHARRMLALAAIGMLHAYLLWFGDVLFFYAVCGLFLYPARHWRVPALLVISLLLLSVLPAIHYLRMIYPDAAYFAPIDWEEMLGIAPFRFIEDELGVYRGSYLEQMPYRIATSLDMQFFHFPRAFVWRTLGVMFLGMALYRMGVLTGRRGPWLYLALVLLALFAGIPLVALGAYKMMAVDWSYDYTMFYGRQYNYWGGIVVALGIIGAVMLVCQRRAQDFAWRPDSFYAALFRTPLTSRLAAVGRMALTSYLMHSVICSLIFYGHGLGLFGYVDRVGQFWITAGIWLLQLLLSPAWLYAFQYGPAEWLWRSVTYGHLQPLRKHNVPAPAAAAPRWAE